MLGFSTETKNEPTCTVTHGVLGHLDPKQPPTKRKPFASILKHDFISKVEFLLPQELLQVIQQQILTEQSRPRYCQVILPLKALLEGDFFNEYIKKGNVLMLSEGRMGVNNMYYLKEGVLSLYLDKETYERTGIVGKPDGIKGKRGTKPRWVIEIDLRLPSMLHGKKGFDRIVYAFTNVLMTPVTWLFTDLATNASTPAFLDTHFPNWKSAAPEVFPGIKVDMPNFTVPTEVDPHYEADFEDFAVETHEWLSLAMLNSPSISPDDKLDPALSRYAPPAGQLESCEIVRIVWHGFLSPAWAHRMFVEILLAVPRQMWFTYHVAGFEATGSKDCTIFSLRDAPNEYMLWEIE